LRQRLGYHPQCLHHDDGILIRLTDTDEPLLDRPTEPAFMIYQSTNQAVFRRIPTGARRILDVGCGGGAFGAALKAARPCTVVGVTYSEAEALQANDRGSDKRK